MVYSANDRENLYCCLLYTSMLRDYGMLAPDEVSQSGKVLKAAAMTYVAAAAAAILQLLRLLMLTGRRRRD